MEQYYCGGLLSNNRWRQRGRTLHRRLQGVYRVDLGDEHSRPERAKGGGAPLADVPVPGDHRHFARQHDVRRTLDAVHERLTTPVQVVKLAL